MAAGCGQSINYSIDWRFFRLFFLCESTIRWPTPNVGIPSAQYFPQRFERTAKHPKYAPIQLVYEPNVRKASLFSVTQSTGNWGVETYLFGISVPARLSFLRRIDIMRFWSGFLGSSFRNMSQKTENNISRLAYPQYLRGFGRSPPRKVDIIDWEVGFPDF